MTARRFMFSRTQIYYYYYNCYYWSDTISK